MPQYGTWIPYAGTDAVLLTVALLAIGVLLTYLGTRLKDPIGTKGPGRTVGIFMLLMWALSLATFLVAVLAYGTQLYQEHLLVSSTSS